MERNRYYDFAKSCYAADRVCSRPLARALERHDILLGWPGFGVPGDQCPGPGRRSFAPVRASVAGGIGVHPSREAIDSVNAAGGRAIPAYRGDAIGARR